MAARTLFDTPRPFNHRLLNGRLQQAMVASKRSGRHGAVMLLDLDNFKPLNDAPGHEAGDLLLVEAANRLRRCVPETDTVARFGGDEFVITLGELSAKPGEATSQAQIVAEKIRAALSKPYPLTVIDESKAQSAGERHYTASIGAALFDAHQVSLDDVLKWTDSARYRARASGRDLVRFHALGV